MAYHYTYRISNILKNKHYYGTRTSIIIPKEDIGIYYFSSSLETFEMKKYFNNFKDYKISYQSLLKSSKTDNTIYNPIKNTSIDVYTYNAFKNIKVRKIKNKLIKDKREIKRILNG